MNQTSNDTRSQSSRDPGARGRANASKTPGWNYDPNSGWYYDPTSNQYYDPRSGKCYDPASGQYYDPNNAKGSDNSLGIVSLVLGILGIFVSSMLIVPIAAIITGGIGLSSPESKNYCRIGMILGICSISIRLILIAAYLIFYFFSFAMLLIPAFL